MNIGMYGMCNTTDTFSTYHQVGSNSNHNHHNNHHLHNHGTSVIHHYNPSSEMAPSYSSASAATPPEHHFHHHHPASYYTTQVSVDTYNPSPNASNQGMQSNETCNSEQRTPPPTSTQTNENTGSASTSYYSTNSGALHQHQHHAQDMSLGPQQQEDNVIIASDNGLSYTNLDYATSNSHATYHHPHNHNTMTSPSHPDHHTVLYPSTTINYITKNHHHHEEMVHQGSHQHEEMLSHHVSHHHQQEGYTVNGGHYMHHSATSPDTGEAAQYSPVLTHHHQSPSPVSAEYHAIHRHYKEEPCHPLLSEMHQHQIHSGSPAIGAGNGTVMMATAGGTGNFHHHPLHHHHMHHQNPGNHHHPHHQHLLQQQQQQQTAAVPTYKWMQVKRNVPKPTGKCLIVALGKARNTYAVRRNTNRRCVLSPCSILPHVLLNLHTNMQLSH